MKIKEKSTDLFDIDEMMQVLDLNDSIACIGDMATKEMNVTNKFKNSISSSIVSINDWLSMMGEDDRKRFTESLENTANDGVQRFSVCVNQRDFVCRLQRMNAHKWIAILQPSSSPPSVTSSVPLEEKLTMGLLILNEKLEIIYVNSLMEEMAEVSLSEHYYEKLSKVMVGETGSLFIRNCLFARDTNQKQDFQFSHDEEECHFSVYPSHQGLAVFGHEKSGKEEGAIPSEETVHLMEKHTNDVFWIADPSFRQFHYLSPSIKRFFGESISGNEAPETLKQFIHPADRKRLDQSLEQMSERKSKVDVRVPGRESVRWVRVTGFPLIHEGNQYVVGTTRDITNDKKAAYLERKSDHLSVISQMSAGIAHEIKNPLTVIKGFLQIGEANPEMQKEYQSVVLKEVERMETIVQDFLFLVKPGSKTEKKEVDVSEIISYTLNLMKKDTEDNDLSLSYKNASEDSILFTDEKRLKQVLLNLVKNAVEAVGEKGEIVVETYRKEDSLAIVVRDDGIGIPEEALIHIGEPFYTTKEKGTGLGVMVTKKIVDDLGGSIHYESEEEKGTTVTVTLPGNP
ncbi:ATP-binding protein [Salimicrobium halophilum]|uniref:histidine kinase n=1 Tax=Salimicrobium halophilum TaxID=86666 RepID=A0A1G8U781_9BACI|nr:ATP-binding protein [Salimicrobium halophilum]SDJ49474.1 two-component system, sporulation sensor kinase A [Salimicrobium halophilum]